MDENENHEYQCWICKKAFVHQKICAIGKCGHAFCKDCIMKFCKIEGKKDEMSCNMCDKNFGMKDLIYLKESGSAFASHSQVEAVVYQPSFKC